MKAAFTRAYNKDVHLTPYSLQVVKKGRRGGGGESELGGEDVEYDVQESEDEGEGIKSDAMIKVRTLNVEEELFYLFWLSFCDGSACALFSPSAEEDQSNQGDQEGEEGRFWQREGEGEGQSKEMIGN